MGGAVLGRKRKRWVRRVVKLSCTILMTVFFLIGTGALFYPFLFDLIYKSGQERGIAAYDSRIHLMDPAVRRKMMAEARAYNRKLSGQPEAVEPGSEEMEEYLRLLDLGDGVMGYLSIPAIDVDLNIYHTVEETALQAGAGHLPGSSLPVGGAGSHCVISGHTGLVTAELFTHLDRLRKGDSFSINVLEAELTYEVEDIRVVLPEETESLAIIPGRDLCTLVTCTPYGVNSHRLLVRGKRIKNTAEGKKTSGHVGGLVRARGPSIAELMALAGMLVIILSLVRWIRKRR